MNKLILITILLATISTSRICLGDLMLAADDLDLVAADFTTIVDQLNANFDALATEIDNLGGNAAVPTVFSRESLGADDLNDAATELRNSDLSSTADDLDLVAVDFTTIVDQLNANFDSLATEIDNLGGNATVPTVFSRESLGADDLNNSATHFRNASVPEPGTFSFCVLTFLGFHGRRRRVA